MWRVLVQGDASSLPDQRRAAFGGDNEASGCCLLDAVLHPGDAGILAQGDLRDLRLAQGRGARAASFVEQGLAVVRMANAERSRDAFEEHAQRQRHGFRRFRRDAFIVGDVAREVMAACFHERVVEAEALRFRDTPGCDPLTAHTVLELRRLLEHQDRLALARHDGGQCRAANAAADDDEIPMSHAALLFHVAGRLYGLRMIGKTRRAFARCSATALVVRLPSLLS